MDSRSSLKNHTRFQTMGKVDTHFQTKTAQKPNPVGWYICMYALSKGVPRGVCIIYFSWILKCDHSKESYWAVLSCGTVYYAVQGGSKFESINKLLMCKRTNDTSLAVRSYCTGFFVFLFAFNI